MADARIRGEVLDWLHEAQEDLGVARELLELGRFSHACFLAQQAAEKALKALALAELRRYERSHDLTELYELVSRCLPLPEDVVSRLPTLSTYYLVARYPNAGLRRPSRAIGRQQAEEAVEVAGHVLGAVKRAIGEA